MVPFNGLLCFCFGFQIPLLVRTSLQSDLGTKVSWKSLAAVASAKAEVRSQELGAKKAVSIQIPRFPGKPIRYNIGQDWLRKESERNPARGCESDRQTNVPGCNTLLDSNSEFCPVCALNSALESESH